jgi:ubiquinone/menaquinone biosynthesis C-methylase UbiE
MASASVTAGPSTAAPVHKRFLSALPGEFEAYIRAAQEYVANIGSEASVYLYQKPYDHGAGNPTYFTNTYNVLNLLQALQLPPGGTVLEVGSGGGWLTEILFCLGFHVFALEPSEDMIKVARERIAASVEHHKIQDPSRVNFLRESLEECSLPDGRVDGIMFHEALHHVVDEERSLAQCFRVLKPDGVFGVTGEQAWSPGDHAIEQACRKEMRQYGTLENPFTTEYLDFLLRAHGFRQIIRYHSVNGFFPVDQENRTLKQAAVFPAWAYNHLTARKPLSDDPTTGDEGAVARATITVVEASRDASSGRVRVKLKLVNSGGVTWLHRRMAAGWVTVSLHRGKLAGPDFEEATNRVFLPRSILPGEELLLDAVFAPAPDARPGPWSIDLVCENRYWFQTRGTRPAAVGL